MARTITTAAELDALPVGSVVLTARDTVWRRMDDSAGDYRFESPEVRGRYQASTFESVGDLPVTVLHDPSGSAPSATREEVMDELLYAATEVDGKSVQGVVRDFADALLDRFNITPKEDR